MNNRRYNTMYIEARQRAQELLSGFYDKFYANELRNARINQDTSNILRQLQEPVEPEEIEGIPEVPPIMYEE